MPRRRHAHASSATATRRSCSASTRSRCASRTSRSSASVKAAGVQAAALHPRDPAARRRGREVHGRPGARPEGRLRRRQPVDVEGTSKGKGFQGVIKKHHMKGMTRTHGTHEYFRHGGSIGCRLTPQRVHKGKRMAGQMGNETKTIQNLQLFQILAEENVHPRPRLDPGRGERLRRRDQGRDAHGVQAQGHGQGRGSLEEPAQGLEEGRCGSRLASHACRARRLRPGVRFDVQARRSLRRGAIAFTRKRRRRASSRARSTSSRRSTTQFELLRARRSACSISAARPGSWLQYARDAGRRRGAARRARSRAAARRCRGRADRRRRRDDDRRRGAARRAAGVRRRAVATWRPTRAASASLDQARSRGAVRARARDRDATCSRRAATSSASCSRGPDFKKLIERVRARFAIAKTAKPESSRQISIEQYVIGKGFRGA